VFRDIGASSVFLYQWFFLLACGLSSFFFPVCRFIRFLVVPREVFTSGVKNPAIFVSLWPRRQWASYVAPKSASLQTLLMSVFPRLYSFARNKISLAHYISNQNIHHNFHTPISARSSGTSTTKPDLDSNTAESTGQIKMSVHIYGEAGNTPQANSTLLISNQ
jgi:hypothetical protein